MNQKKFAVWITVIFLITACARATTTGEVLAGQVPSGERCPDSVTIQGDRDISMVPGETISLAVAPTSYGWQYQWSAPDMSLLSAPQKSITDFTAPSSGGEMVVTVAVTSHQECEVLTDAINISIASPPTFTPGAGVAAQPTNTPTLIVAPTDTPTIVASATNTVEPTAHFTNTPHPTLLPSHTPTAIVPAFTILLQEPKDNTCVGTDNAIFQWLATRPLNSTEGVNGEYFAINIWSDDSPRYSVSWIKDSRYEIDNITNPIAAYTQQINCSGDNGCYWNVDMIVSHVERGSGWKPESFTLIASSPVRKFCTYANPDPPPTNTPVPPPTPTPCNLPASQCK